MIWEKLFMNVTFSGPSAVTGLTIGEVMEDANAWTVALGCAKEAIAVAHASGVELAVGDPIAHIRNLGGKIPDARRSMLIDSTGPSLAWGASWRSDAVNDTLVAVIKEREARLSSD